MALADHNLSQPDLIGFAKSQQLAMQGAREVADLICDGWTEKQAANLLDVWLQDHGVRGFFHHSFAWFGERTRFDGINKNLVWQFQPTDRVLLPGDVFILDVAPIVDGYISDVGYTGVLGEHREFESAKKFLFSLRQQIAQMFVEFESGEQIWAEVLTKIHNGGYEAIHRMYPMSVLGHRVYKTSNVSGVKLLHFGWQSYWSLFSRGLFSELFTPNYRGALDGLWAIEPHLGGKGFGLKFEELILVENNKAEWVSEMPL